MVDPTIPKRIWRIYKITCATSGKSYIGQTVRPISMRWGQHWHAVKKPPRTACPVLQKAMKKYGKEAFGIEVIGTAPSLTEANILECSSIALHGTLVPNGYNVTTGGAGVPGVRRRHTPEAIARMCAAQKGKVNSPEARHKMSLAKRGRKLTDAHKKKIGAAGRGRRYYERDIAKLSRPGLRGISPAKDRWMARIKENGKTRYIGTYDTKEEAGAAYRAEADKRVAFLREKIRSEEQRGHISP